MSWARLMGVCRLWAGEALRSPGVDIPKGWDWEDPNATESAEGGATWGAAGAGAGAPRLLRCP